MSRVAPHRPPVNGGVADMALDFLTRLNVARREMLGPAPAPPRVAPVIDVPGQRDQRQEMEIVTIACANTMREQLEEQTGDRLDLAVAIDIASRVLETYYDAKVALIRGRR